LVGRRQGEFTYEVLASKVVKGDLVERRVRVKDIVELAALKNHLVIDGLAVESIVMLLRRLCGFSDTRHLAQFSGAPLV